MESIYRVEGAVAHTSALAGGPWDPKLQHGSAPSSLICWAVERLPSAVPMRVARLTVDPAQDTSEQYVLVPLPALIEAAAQNYKREGIAIAFDSGPIGEGVPTTAPIQLRSPEILHGLNNLIQNAVQFARREVTVTTYWDARRVTVEITDDGPGFMLHLLGRLGEPYLSTRSGAADHMGLGIFIAQSLLERSGAHLVGYRQLRELQRAEAA